MEELEIRSSSSGSCPIPKSHGYSWFDAFMPMGGMDFGGIPSQVPKDPRSCKAKTWLCVAIRIFQWQAIETQYK